MSGTAGALLTTCLYDSHRSLGARLVPFAGWSMPVQYSGILEEHRAVRTSAGLFDVSHMGRIVFTGPDCVPYLQRIFTCDVTRLGPGLARYTLICNEKGGILDDTILYCRGQEKFLLVCNAANRTAVWDWLHQWKEPGTAVEIEDRTFETGMLALQGPAAAEHMAALVDPDLVLPLKTFSWTHAPLFSQMAMVSRTGYTGEDGFELILSADRAAQVWAVLIERGVKPCGLGARDTLRLEAALPLHGNDIGPSTSPVEAGLMWTVDLKTAFIGREAIAKAKEEEPSRRLAGFELLERAIPRQHCEIRAEGRTVGEVTSGGFSPTLGKGIGMGYLEHGFANPGTPLEVDIRGRPARAQTVRRPFYRRSS